MFNAMFYRRNKRDYPGMVKDAEDKWLPLAGVVVQGRAKRLAPVDTGNLRGSITWQTKTDGAIPEGGGPTVSKPSDSSEVYVGTNVDYAQHIEYGTVRSEAQPYLRPAIDRNRRRLMTELARLLKEAIRGNG